MKKFLCVLCVLCGSVFSHGLDRHAFTFTDYNLGITLDPPKSSFSAQGSVTLRNDTAEPQRIAVLQISSSLDWRSITVAGRRVQYVSQPYTTDVDHTGALSEAIVTLPAPVPPGGTVELAVAYSGAITQDATRLTRIGVPEKMAQQSDWDRIADPYTAVRGIGYVAWYPIATEAVSLSAGNEVFDEIGAWKQREALAKMVVNIVPRMAPQTTIAFTGSVPALVAGPYQRLDRPGLKIDYLPAHQPLADDFARAISNAAPLVTEWFGPPKRPVHVIELPWPGASPWESGPLLLTELKQEQPTKLEFTLVHQVAHAAFDSPRPWIYEGAAHFAQALEHARQEGRPAALDSMQAQSDPLVTAERPPLPNAPGRNEKSLPRRPESLATTADEVFYRTKAMYVWWMLRDMVGDAALQRALHAYRPGDDREPSYVQRLVEAESRRKLEWFFDDWVYRDRGLPDFRIDAVHSRAALNGTYLVTITVENRGDAGAEVPVIIQTGHGEITRRLEVHARDKAFLRLEVPEAPRRVTVNDGSVPELDRSNNSFEAAPASQ